MVTLFTHTHTYTYTYPHSHPLTLDQTLKSLLSLVELWIYKIAH